jgi:colanic acid biosynthesis glycosyl transferase WcaI
MKLLILGINRAPEPIGIAPYTTELGRWLAARGHEVAMVSAQPYYPAWRVSDGYPKHRWTRAVEDGVSVTRCPIYVPANPSGARRIAHHASFAANALLPTVRRAQELRPDVIMAIAPSLLAAPVALAAARLMGGRTWLHVQDLEVDAAFATGLLDAASAVAYRASSFEAWLLRRFDRVSTISSRMGERLMDKGVAGDRIVEFRNWADTEKIFPLAKISSYRSRWNITTPHVALYSGNLANKQGIEIVIEAAHHLRNRSDVTFVICGEGSSRDRVAAEVTNLTNVQLHDLQPREMLGELLGLATVHLLPQVAAAADLMLPSKLTNILASGRPVIASASPGTSLATEVDGCGVVTPPGDSSAFASGIVALLDNSERYAAAAAAARARAVERWSRDAILTQVERELESLTR